MGSWRAEEAVSPQTAFHLPNYLQGDKKMGELKNDVFSSIQMDGMSIEKQLLKAVKHVLGQIMQNPHLAYNCGLCTQSFSLLTEAYANATQQEVKAVREEVFSAIQDLDLSQVEEEREALDKYKELKAKCRNELKDGGNGASLSEEPIDGMSIIELLEKITPIAADVSLPNLTRTNILSIRASSNYVLFQ
jgi:NifU-like protein involved in Fe-S cluster formation